jgi:hypothetical protein
LGNPIETHQGQESVVTEVVLVTISETLLQLHGMAGNGSGCPYPTKATSGK